MKRALNTHLLMMYWKQDYAQACVSVVTAGHLHVGRWRGGRDTDPRSVRCILKALWRQLNVRLMARSWQNDCTIELAVMMAHITR